MKKTEGFSIDGDDMHWIVNCPECDKEFEYEGFFDSSDKTNCNCGCVFTTEKVWLDDNNFMK